MHPVRRADCSALNCGAGKRLKESRLTFKPYTPVLATEPSHIKEMSGEIIDTGYSHIFMGYGMMIIPYRYLLSNDHIGVINISISSHSMHFYALRTFLLF